MYKSRQAPTLAAALVVAAAIAASLGAPRGAQAQTWVWPISASATPDAMNTSFGPRINNARWDFHDGIDLPAPIGTPVVAVAAGTIFREGPGGTDGYSSRHVVLSIPHPTDGTLFVPYLHLDSIAGGIAEGGAVAQGTVLGTVGDDDATYSHLHFEVRRGGATQIRSVHPLHYLPYANTANFGTPALDRLQLLASGRLARLTFSAASRLEGDLARIEVDLRQGSTVLATRVVDLDDKTTVNEGNADGLMWRGDIALEGYQRSNMVADGRTDLHYGVLVRRLPAACDNVVARVRDIGGTTVSSAALALPAVASFAQHLDFEDDVMPPAGWSVATSSSGSGTTLAIDAAAALDGGRGLHPRDLSSSEGASQTASLEIAVPAARIGWSAEGLFRPVALGLGAGQNAYLLYFRSGTGLAMAASARNNAGIVQTGILVKNPDASTTSSFSGETPALGVVRRWTLDVTRLGTRETIAVLYLDGIEVVRKAWDGRSFQADSFRAGLGFTSAGATAELHADEIRLDDGGLTALPSFRAGEAGTLMATRGAGGALDLTWNAGCSMADALDFVIVDGTLGDFDSHLPVTCTTGGMPFATYTPPSGNRYFLVVPRTAAGEGSYGTDSAGAEIPAATAPCDDAPDPGCG